MADNKIIDIFWNESSIDVAFEVYKKSIIFEYITGKKEVE